MAAVATPEPATVTVAEEVPAAITLVGNAGEHDEELGEAVVHAAPEGVQQAERTMWRSAAIGIAIGVPTCALVWMGLTALAVAIAGFHVSSWPGLMLMAATVGAFAGCFFGGWAGVTVSAEQLEEAEKAAEPHRALTA
jgi:hypothetical protein